MLNWITRHKLIATITILVVVGGVFFSLRSEPALLAQVETTTVERQSVQQIVSETGVVQPVSDAKLSFSASGRVGEVLVREGEEVRAGDLLARLDNLSHRAGLRKAEANLTREEALLSRQQGVDDTNIAAARTKVRSAEENLVQVKETQDELVESAREDLYTSNLTPYLADGGDDNPDYDFSPPTVTGTYQYDQPGEYRIDLYTSNSDTGWSFRYSGPDSGAAPVSTSQPQPIGDSGLFIEFPDDFGRNISVEWVLEIPNTRSANYTTLKNALQQAKDTRESAITQARNNLADAQAALAQARSQAESSFNNSQQLTSQQASVAAARAQVTQAEVALDDTHLTAPFDGVITSVDINLGENTTANQPIMEIISSDQFTVSVDVPEADIAQIDVGDTVSITLDAFDNQVFSGEVIEIAPAATTRSGVQVVEVTVAFTESVSDIKSGLSADVDIAAAEKTDTLAIPSRAIQGSVGNTYVYKRTSTADGLVRQPVTVGLRGSDGNVEVTSGLEAGDEVVTFISNEVRNQLRAEGIIE